MELKSKLVAKRLDSDEEKELEIDITDVSKTGVGFICNEALTIGAVYEAFLTIWTKEIIHAFIEIVRIVKREEGGYQYGGIFVGMPDIDAKRIEVYEMVNKYQD
ncbi:MAG: PilZ domain-containing protein [bacterium]|nr:PilZ domain-containing protein [bacterium]